MNDYDFDILKLARDGYCCSQIVLHLALDLQGRENPGLLRAMSGLCQGFSAAKGACGALTGAACLLAYYGGKGRADEEANERLPLMLTELVQWFELLAAPRFGGIHCSDIVGDGTPDNAICSGLVGDCYGKAMTLLVENGFDPTDEAHGA